LPSLRFYLDFLTFEVYKLSIWTLSRNPEDFLNCNFNWQNDGTVSRGRERGSNMGPLTV